MRQGDQEAVELRFRQWEGAFLLDRVLGSANDQEGGGQGVRAVVHGDPDAPSIASSRQDWVRGVARLMSSARMMLPNNGPGRNLNSPRLLIEDVEPVDVGGQQVGR